MSKSIAQTDPLTGQVAEYIDAKHLVPSRAGVVVGVSGGADSVALLAVLGALADRPGREWRLTVAHLNHGLRAGAEADAAFVGELAQARSLPLVAEARDVAAEAKRAGEGIEQAARRLRYEFLGAAAERCGASVVAVGHHADDNVETVLYRIARGTHLRGLAGIPASRPLGGPEVKLVRPLLGCRRKQIEEFCRRNGLRWRTDETNLDVRYRRNFIRNELLPLMKDKLNPSIDQAVDRLAAAAGEVEQYMQEAAAEVLRQVEMLAGDKTIELDSHLLARQPKVIRRYVMRLALEKLSVPLVGIGWQRLEELAALADQGGPAAVALGGGFVARSLPDRVLIAPAEQKTPTETWVVSLECPGRTDLPDGGEITCRIEPFGKSSFQAHCLQHASGVEVLDADRIRGPLVCRSRRDGDVFQPLGCKGRQSVSDFLTNLKLPPPQRDLVRCICDDKGIVYLAPLRIDQRVKVTAQSETVVQITVTGLCSR